MPITILFMIHQPLPALKNISLIFPRYSEASAIENHDTTCLVMSVAG